MKVSKNSVGRPSIYRTEFCEMVIELGGKGKSLEQIATSLGVGLRTLFTWRDAHEEFRHALSDAKTFELAFWENLAQTYLIEIKNAPRLNAGLWTRSMAARFPQKYSDRQKKDLLQEESAKPFSGIQIFFVKPEGIDDKKASVQPSDHQAL